MRLAQRRALDSVLQKARARRAGQRSMTGDEFVTWAYGLTNVLRLASYAPQRRRLIFPSLQFATSSAWLNTPRVIGVASRRAPCPPAHSAAAEVRVEYAHRSDVADRLVVLLTTARIASGDGPS